jgi:hypothetical protein
LCDREKFNRFYWIIMRNKAKKNSEDFKAKPYSELLPLNIESNSMPLLPIDEADEYFDPFSNLNRFLLKKVKEAISSGSIRQEAFSLIEKDLVHFILPDFKIQYPKYRLGGYALKRIYETVLYYYNHVQSSPSLFNEDKTLNLFAMIRELLSQIDLAQNFHSFHPYSFAHRIARQVTECAIILDTKAPSLDHLTKLTWSSMQNLIPRKNIKNHLAHSPFDVIETKMAFHCLEICSDHHSQESLKEALLSYILPYQELLSLPHIKGSLLMLAAQIKKKNLEIFSTYNKETLQEIEFFLKSHMKWAPHLEFTSVVDQTIVLYRLTSGLSKTLFESEIESAKHYILSLSSNQFKPTSFPIGNSVYSYINSEIVAMREIKPTELLEKIEEAYKTGSCLPKMNEDQLEELKIWAYTLLEERTNSLNSISSSLKEILSHEIVMQCTLSPLDSLESITKECFQKLLPLKKALEECKNLEEKAEIIASQNEMVAYFLNLPKSNLSSYLKEQMETQTAPISNEQFDSVKAGYLKLYKEAAPYESEVGIQIRALTVLLSYHQLRHCSRSNYHFFLKRQEEEEIEKVSNLKLPLIPYRPKAFHSYLKRKGGKSQKESEEC